MPRVLLPSFALVCALIWTGCPNRNGNGNQNTDGGAPSDFVGRACNVDAECGDLRCDTIRHQCICLSDESCKVADPNAPPRYCNNYTGLCVEEISGCRSDSDCDPTEYCDSSIRSCRPKKSFCAPCSADHECGGVDDHCIEDPNLGDMFCATACTRDADCPRGASCQDKNGILQCWPAPNPITPNEPSTCRTFKGCTPDSLRTCNSNADCAELGDQRCDAAQGRCVAIEQVCPFGTVCDPRAKICVAECSADADCGDPVLHCVNRVCEPVNECTADDQCPANKVCSIPVGQTTGQCVPFCQTDQECPIGQICKRGEDNRYRCTPGCATNANCPLDQRCNTAQQVCEGPVVGTARTCQATPACNTCEVCDPTRSECVSAKLGGFPHCQPCTPGPNACPGGACVLTDDGSTFCAQFCGTNGVECPQGFACLGLSGGTQSVCVPSDRRCAGKCP
ncbi:MAG: hypothetical protein IRZ16_15865 [Myxococcaceae bacterium]|nr:hypothetical protein [Myxococcaceae bacterium]